MKIDGIKTSYIDEGKGEPLLILHGWGCNGEVYRGIIDFLSPRFRVIVPDLPGFGKSDEPENSFGVGDYKDFIIKFCKELQLQKFILFGHSLGGRICIKLLSDLPHGFIVNNVILTGSAGIKPQKNIKSKIKIRIYKLGKLILQTKPLIKLFPDLMEKHRQKHGSPDYLSASPIMRSALVKIVNEDLTWLLSKINSEVLLIWGENDDQTPLSDGKLMEKLIPNSGLAIIPSTGHYAFLEKPSQFNSILKSYFKDWYSDDL